MSAEPAPGATVVLWPSRSVVLPDDLLPGTWRVAHAAADELGAYVFEVR